jgi:hypothetical protein
LIYEAVSDSKMRRAAGQAALPRANELRWGPNVKVAVMKRDRAASLLRER